MLCALSIKAVECVTSNDLCEKNCEGSQPSYCKMGTEGSFLETASQVYQVTHFLNVLFFKFV